MPRYFFHLLGMVSGHDLTGHECVDDDEAKAHGIFIAHREGTERPEMIQGGNAIQVENDRGDEIAKIPLATTSSS